MNLLDVSEIVIGLALEGVIQPDHISVAHIHPNYQEAAKLLQKKVDMADFIDRVGTNKLTAVKSAANAIDKNYPWLDHLERSYRKEEQADLFEKQAKRLRNGQDIDSFAILSSVQDDYNTSRYMTMDKVKATQDVWQPTYYSPLDEYMGGIPAANMTIIAGPPGTGKTSLMIKLCSQILTNTNKKVLTFSLEMTRGQIKRRLMEVLKMPIEAQQRYIVSEEVMPVNQVYAEANKIAGSEPLAAITIDFADLMSMEEDTEQAVGMIYRTCANLAKKTHVPVLLLSQLNRNYVSGIPRITHIRWSGLAEAMAAMIVLLYNPNQIWADQGKDDRLPAVRDTGYLIIGKSRFGFKEGGVGAIHVPWIGENGWGDEPLGWYPLGNVS